MLIDQRVNLTNEIIEGIRLIKMYAWEKAFMKATEILRRKELAKIVSINLYNQFEHAISNSVALFVSFFIFTIVN
jgi:ATP-binding cassette, subfamily C (CFTR/MRP), member 4